MVTDLIRDIKEVPSNYSTDPNTEAIIRNFGVDVNSAEPVYMDGFRPTTDVCKIAETKFDLDDVYVVNTPEIVQIGCHPHIVGEELRALTDRAADEVVRAMIRFGGFDPENTVICEVLRASTGYRMQEAFKRAGLELPFELPVVHIRPRYETPSYRDHDTGEKIINIIYQNFKKMPAGRRLKVIKHDTEASFKTSRAVIPKLMEFAEERGSKIDEIILAGYISDYSLGEAKKIAEKLGIGVKAFAYGNVTSIYSNHYDMPVFGPDEALWREIEKILRDRSLTNDERTRKLFNRYLEGLDKETREKERGCVYDEDSIMGKLMKKLRLGCTTSLKILEQYSDKFIPGADQPGDWSARQSELYNGNGIEQGEIIKHLCKSLEFIGNLYRMHDLQKRGEYDFGFLPYHNGLMEQEISELQSTLNRYLEESRLVRYISMYSSDGGQIDVARALSRKPLNEFLAA